MRFITFKQLGPEKGIPYCRNHLRRKVKAGEFPAPVNISDVRIGWIEAEVDRWIEARAAERSEQPKAA